MDKDTNYVKAKFQQFVTRPLDSENNPRVLYFSRALFEGLIFGRAYIRRGLCTEGNVRFKIDGASLIVGRKFTVFALLYFVFEGNFQVQAPRGAYIRTGDLTEGFLRYRFRGLIFREAYFRNFTVSLCLARDCGLVRR